MTEKELEAEVLALVDRLKYRVLIIPDSKRIIEGRGYPDLTIFSNNAVLWRELKTQDASLSRDQQRWRYVIQAAGGNWALWRPVHLWSGQIETELRQIA